MTDRRFEVADYAVRIDVHGIKGKSPDRLPNGSGFLLDTKHGVFLVTCWHLVTNRHPGNNGYVTGTGQPTEIGVWFRLSGQPNTWLKAYYPLATDGSANYIAHPNPKSADVVLLPIVPPEGTDLSPIKPRALGGAADLYACTQLAIPGFPFGIQSGLEITGFGGHPICKTVHLATPIEFNHNGRLVALVDGTARPGMSGSPVMIRDQAEWICCGIYSAQDEVTELGEVTKISAINDCLGEAKKNPRDPISPTLIRRAVEEPVA